MLDLLAFAAIAAPLLAAITLAALALTARPVEAIAIPAAPRPAATARAPERRAILIATLGALLGLAGALAALVADRPIPGPTWFTAGDLRVAFDLAPTRATAAYAALTHLLVAVTAAFSGRYLHREPGLPRFLALSTAFAAGVALVALAAHPILVFAGWELAGTTSVLLIGYHTERPGARHGALRALATNKLGDAAFIAGIALALAYGPSPTTAGLWCIAAALKAGLVPATPWVERAIEGPTPSSALFYGAAMTHAGLLLAARAWPDLDRHPGWTALFVTLALLTAAYGFTAGRAQPDVKSRLVLHGVAWIGLAFALLLLAGPVAGLALGAAHMVARYAAMLLAPAELQARRLAPRARRPVPAALRRAARDRYGLEDLHVRLIERPITALARAVANADARAAIAPEPPAFAPAAPEGPPDTGRLHALGGRVSRLIEALEHHVLGGKLLAAADPDRHPRRSRLQGQIERAFAHPLTLALLAAAFVLWLGRP